METVTAQVLDTNCYVIGADDADECVIVDPGIHVADAVLDRVRSLGRVIEAIVVTHGHVDHTFDIGRVQGTFPAPAVIGTADRYRLDDPFGTVGPPLAPMLEPLRSAGVPVEAAQRLTDGDVRNYAGLNVTAMSAPGHNEGSTLFIVDDPSAGSNARTPRRFVFTGDVLFAGTIGRTDLLGGDDATMQQTLTTLADSSHPLLTDDATVLPGHGPTSTFADERAGNPFLQSAGG